MASSVSPPAARKLLLSVHLASAVGAFGADLAILALGVASIADATAQPLAPAAALVAQHMVQPLALATPASGLLLAWIGGYGLLRHWWVAVKLAIVLALVGAVFFFLVPSLNQLAALGASDEVEAREAVAMVIAPAGAGALLLLSILLGVIRPGSRRAASAPAGVRS